MRKMLFAIGIAALIAGCATPLQITVTTPSGETSQVDVTSSDGTVVQVSNDLKKKVDLVKAAIEAEIKTFLEGVVKAGDFKKEYSISIDGVVAKSFTEPLSEEDKAVFRAVGEALTREYVKQMVYPAWAKSLLAGVLPTAKAKLAEGDYAGTREAIWGVAKSGVEEVDELVRKSGARFLNKSVNPAQWLMLEKELTTKVDELLAAKDYDGARKWVEAFAEIRAYSKSLSEAPAQAPEDTEDSLTVTDGKPSGLLGTAAVNVRIAKLKEKLIAAVAAAKKADLDARMQKLINELKAKVIALVEEGKFDEARVVIRDVALVKDNEWDAKIYAMRIGLMNSIVNPNQLKHLKAEADKIINDFVAQKKYAEAIKYIDEYPYVHDTFAQIKASFDKIEKAMTGLKLDDGKSAEYVTSRLAAVRTLMEKRLGRYNSDDDFSELEKALGELEKGYVAQHYDSAAATNVTVTIKGEIIAMIDAMYAPITTWEMNEALRRFLASKRPRMPVAAPPADGDGVVPVVALPAPAMGVISEDVDYDAQIAMAEAAIAQPASVYGLEAVLGDYARIMRRCKAGNSVGPGEANTMLIASVFLNQPEIFKLALTLNANVNAAARHDGLVRPPLLLAVQLGRIEFIKLVQGANGKCDVADASGNTLLHYAAERGNLAVFRASVPAVKIDAVNKAGETALFVAVRRNQLAVVKAILQLVGDAEAQEKYVTLANGAGENVFDVACKSNGHMLLDTLVEAGAKYDERHLAAALLANCIGVAQWLVEKGLDVNAAVVHKAAKELVTPNTVLKYLTSEGMKLSVAGGKNTEMTPKKPAEKSAEKSTKSTEKDAAKEAEKSTEKESEKK